MGEEEMGRREEMGPGQASSTPVNQNRADAAFFKASGIRTGAFLVLGTKLLRFKIFYIIPPVLLLFTKL